METMRTLSLSMLLAGCGLHAVHTISSCEPTKVGNFHFISDYRGQRNLNQSVSENEEPFSDSDYEDDSDGYISESFSEEEEMESLEQSATDTHQDSENLNNQNVEKVIESKVDMKQNIGIDISKKRLAAEKPVTQTETSTPMFESKGVVLPIIIGSSAVFSLGYAVYKYVSAKKDNQKEEIVKEAQKK